MVGDMAAGWRGFSRKPVEMFDRLLGFTDCSFQLPRTRSANVSLGFDLVGAPGIRERLGIAIDLLAR